MEDLQINEISEIKVIFDFQRYFKKCCQKLVYFYSPSETEPVFFIAPNSDIEESISDMDIKNKVAYFFEFYFSNYFYTEVTEISNLKIRGWYASHDCRKVQINFFRHETLKQITLIFLDQKSVAHALSSVHTNKLYY